jgi:hypothetical protein
MAKISRFRSVFYRTCIRFVKDFLSVCSFSGVLPSVAAALLARLLAQERRREKNQRYADLNTPYGKTLRSVALIQKLFVQACSSTAKVLTESEADRQAVEYCFKVAGKASADEPLAMVGFTAAVLWEAYKDWRRSKRARQSDMEGLLAELIVAVADAACFDLPEPSAAMPKELLCCLQRVERCTRGNAAGK